MTVGKRIKNKRKEKGLTLKLLSEKCGLSISFLSDIEQGRRKPSLERLKDIAAGLDTTISFLLAEEQKMEQSPGDEEKKLNNIYATEDKSQQFREVLQKIKGFDKWSYEDKEELIIYLKVKEKIRKSKEDSNRNAKQDRN